LEVALWRAVTVYRFAALGYATILMLNSWHTYTRPWLGWTVLGVMALWSVIASIGYTLSSPSNFAVLTSRFWKSTPLKAKLPARCFSTRKDLGNWPLLIADLLVTLACLLASAWVVPANLLQGGAATLPMAWVAAVVLTWAISGGRRRGVFAALAIGAADLWLRGAITDVTVNATVLLFLAGFVIGYVVGLARDADQQMQRATELEAATRERERLARGIHDSVLQVLALIARKGAELGGEAAELGRLAGEQEATLRALVSVDAPVSAAGTVDLRETLRPFASTHVELASPATAVPVTAHIAGELAAAVGSALDNVRVHCGPSAKAWVLVEDEGGGVTVTIRDDGPGIAPGRLDRAAAEGRLGVAQSIVGRLRDIGGTAIISGNDGTEVELKVPR
jgi:signal transduction histidine kinase